MLDYISQISTIYLLNRKIINIAQKDTFIYGFSLFYSSFFTAISILILAIFFNSINLGITFILYFFLPRLFIGGYHAKTYPRCYIISNLIFCLTIVIQNFCIRKYIICFYFISFFYFIFLLYKQHFSLKTYALFIIQFAICILLLLYQPSISSEAMITTIIVAILSFLH